MLEHDNVFAYEMNRRGTSKKLVSSEQSTDQVQTSPKIDYLNSKRVSKESSIAGRISVDVFDQHEDLSKMLESDIEYRGQTTLKEHLVSNFQNGLKHLPVKWKR